MARILITGANGHLGRRLIQALVDDNVLEAVVRSPRAQRRLAKYASHPNLTVHLIDPLDSVALGGVAHHCDRAVHLLGTIKASAKDSLASSHERPARALIEAVRGSAIQQILYVSILGASANSNSECLRRRAAVENLLSKAEVSAFSLRVPMVLGENDRASAALAKRAAAAYALVFRAASLEQPIYAGDVIDALSKQLAGQATNQVVELAGPESLSRGALIKRAAAVMDRKPHVISLPLRLGLLTARLFGGAAAVDMLRILDHDDHIDAATAARELGIALTPLDEMLRRCLSAS